MNRVFLCYASRDKGLVRRLAKDLHRHGVDVWLDENEIRVGDSLRESIENGLERADFVIIALSKAAVRRPWVKREMNAAFVLEEERGTKVILPALIEDMPVPLFLRDKKIADFRNRYNTGLDAIIDAISPATQPHKLETLSCNILLDVVRLDGSLARLTKVQKFRCTETGADGYTECMTSDGNLDEFRVSPGSITSANSEDGKIHVHAAFPHVLRRGQTFTRTFSCNAHDSLTTAEEYYVHRQHTHSRNTTLTIRFPKGRPPISWRAEEKKGHDRVPLVNSVKRKTVKGKPALQLVLDRPHINSEYIVYWTW